MPSRSRFRPPQFSLQTLLIGTAVVAASTAASVAIHRGQLQLAPIIFVHYCFLLFAVGPWFAYLLAECLPIAAPPLRTAVANMILLALFVATLKLAEATLPGPVILVVAVAALILWTPQYMIFFVWRMGD
ncbi:MAG: hypothetical protein JF612_04885 [Planctomycetia bacterium]|jgi:hypothetical protein|nr:hypothetical protein [Planctomycetia bacterium]